MKTTFKMILGAASVFALCQCTTHVDADDHDGVAASTTTQTTTDYGTLGATTTTKKTTTTTDY